MADKSTTGRGKGREQQPKGLQPAPGRSPRRALTAASDVVIGFVTPGSLAQTRIKKAASKVVAPKKAPAKKAPAKKAPARRPAANRTALAAVVAQDDLLGRDIRALARAEAVVWADALEKLGRGPE